MGKARAGAALRARPWLSGRGFPAPALFHDLVQRQFDDAARARGVEAGNQFAHLLFLDHSGQIDPVRVGEKKVRELIPRLFAAGARGIIELPLNKIVE